MQETWVQFLGWEDPLEEEMATHFSILAWKIPQREDLRGYRAAKSLTRMSHWTCTQSCKYCCYLCLTNGEASLLFSHQILSDSLRLHGLYTPWNSLGQNTGVDSLSLLQGIPTQGSNPDLLHCRQILYQLSYQGSPHLLRNGLKYQNVFFCEM